MYIHELLNYIEKNIATDTEKKKRFTPYGEQAPVVEIDKAINKVIFNDPCTIVCWKDGTKTVVRCCDSDKFDKEKGLAMAIIKRLCGNKGSFNEIFKKHLGEDY